MQWTMMRPIGVGFDVLLSVSCRFGHGQKGWGASKHLGCRVEACIVIRANDHLSRSFMANLVSCDTHCRARQYSSLFRFIWQVLLHHPACLRLRALSSSESLPPAPPEEAKNAFTKAIASKDLTGAPVLVLANKHDIVKANATAGSSEGLMQPDSSPGGMLGTSVGASTRTLLRCCKRMCFVPPDCCVPKMS